MKLKGCVFGFLSLLTLSLRAQSDYKDGFIILNSRDTVFGTIEFCGDLLMSKSCKFKTKDEIKEYFPGDISGYRFTEDGNYFVSSEISGKKVFLECLISGHLNIYYLRDKSGDRFFLEKKGGSLTEIPYEESTRIVDGKQMYYQSKTHIGLLSFYLKDAPELQSTIQSLKVPGRKNLIKLARDYNNAECSKQEKCVIYAQKQASIKASFVPSIGIIKYNKFDNSFVQLGCYLNFSFNKINNSFSIKTGLFNFRADNEDGDNINVVKVPLQVEYIFKSHRIQPKLSAGCNFLTYDMDANWGLYTKLCLNAGLDYHFSNRLSLCSNINSDYTSLNDWLSNADSFHMSSYSFDIGLRIDL